MASSLYGSLLMLNLVLLMLVYVSARGQASTDHIALPTAQNGGDCTLEIKVRTGRIGTDSDVSLRIYDAEDSEVVDIADLDKPGDDFEANHVDTFVYKNQPCLKAICAAKVTHQSTLQAWSFESIDIKVKTSDGKVLSHMFGAHGLDLFGSASASATTNIAVVGSCAY